MARWLAWIVGGVLVETWGCTAGRTAVDGGNVSWTDFGCNGSMSALDAHDGPMVSEHFGLGTDCFGPGLSHRWSISVLSFGT